MSEETKFTALGADYWKARCDEWMAANERLIRERDENKRAFDEISKQLGILMTIRDRQYEEAEQRGYRKGVQDAAKVAGSHDGCCEDFADCGYCTKAHILALLEQTSDSNRPHPEIGAVPKSET